MSAGEILNPKNEGLVQAELIMKAFEKYLEKRK